MKTVCRWAGLACLLGVGVVPLVAPVRLVPIAIRVFTVVGCVLLAASGSSTQAQPGEGEGGTRPIAKALFLFSLISAEVMFALAFVVPLGTTKFRWATAVAALIACLSLIAGNWSAGRAQPQVRHG